MKKPLESYRVTTRHPASKHGVPVLLCEEKPVSMAKHLDGIMRQLNMTRKDLSDKAGISTRQLDNFRMGRRPASAAFLNLLGDLIDAATGRADQ